MNSALALIPVILMIFCGFVVAKLGLVKQEHIKGIANLVFLVLLPALLFRSMAQVDFSHVSYFPIFIYLGVAEFIFLSVAFALGGGPRSFVIGLSCVFSNHMMVGIPLVTLAYGPQALITLITLVSVHSLVLLTFAAVCIEFSAARLALKPQQEGSRKRHPSMWSLFRVFGKTMFRAFVHPVILPVVLGVLWAMTGWALPDSIDKALLMLGQANSALSLVLVGLMLAYAKINMSLMRRVAAISAVKNIVFPACVFGACWFFGVRGIPLAVLTIGAGLPIGNNVLLFAMRYKEEQDLITAAVAMSTLTSVATLAVTMTLLGYCVL